MLLFLRLSILLSLVVVEVVTMLEAAAALVVSKPLPVLVFPLVVQ